LVAGGVRYKYVDPLLRTNMNRTRLGLVGAAAVGGAVALWSRYSLLASRSTESVDYTVERTLDDRTEIRRYPELVRVETTGSSNREAFGDCSSTSRARTSRARRWR